MHTFMGGHVLSAGCLVKVLAFYLLNVIIQSDDSQGRGEVGTGGDSRSHWGGLTHIALIGGKLEIRCLVVLIQDFDNEVSVGREGVTVVLFSLKLYEKRQEWVKSLITSLLEMY